MRIEFLMLRNNRSRWIGAIKYKCMYSVHIMQQYKLYSMYAYDDGLYDR